ncbi:TonB-dependent receptor [Shewanella sp. 3B26]|uniref:TonB-dependent receptor n=1 Tax=Shewanella zhuhaiensis TaxID=2919576 RepID=A0AAJ1FA34_9GAMM|nr:TonB-dependent receptor [Shewanella zhuhaiensis]MCH4293675.1 TonB-dependent receptor [Shewanella zhuhaiensis]
MLKNSMLAKSVRFALVAGAATSAFALPAAFAADEGEKVERIEVTGSRIKRTDMEGANPVTSIDAAAIEKMSVNNVGDLLQNLTSSAGAAVNTQTNNGGDSSTRFSLRGIGSDRTLVLINGRRVVAGGGGANSSVDLNTIPTAIVKRVEVLKDGASATYGSDAIAGVVNIITKDDFEGFEFKVNYGGSDKGDATQKGVDVTFGTASDRGNVVVALGYNTQGDAFMGDREFSEFELRAYPDGHTEPGGSSAPPWGNYNTADGRVSRGPDYGDWRAYDGGTDSYNYNPVNYLQTPSTRRYASLFANYTLGEFGFLGEVNAFAEGNYVQTVGNRLLAPEPLAPLVFFGQEAPYSPNNYYNQKYGPKDANGNAYEIADWRRRMLETGGRADMRDYKTFRTAVGFNGVLSNGWDWEVAYTWGQSDATTRGQGYFNLDRVAEAVGPTGWLDGNGNLIVDGAGNPVVDGSGSQLVCLDSDNNVIDGCVPLNVFGVPGTDTEITADMLQYISGDYNTTELGRNSQEVVQAVVSGDLFDLPAGSVGFAAGWEYRKESGSYTPDSLILQGITTAGSAVGTNGGYDVQEFFGEVIIPILADKPLAHMLDVEAALRYSDYSTFGTNTSGKLGIKWMPVETLMVRATISDAFRAPTTSDLFGGASLGYPEAVDPCDANFYTDAEYAALKASPNWANCVATGVPANGYDSGGVEQIPTYGGGAENWNGLVDLGPETADVLTVGFVYNPDFIENLSMTVDYWEIDLKNAISTVGTATRLNGCFEQGEYCNTIKRFGADSAAAGSIISVDDYTVNVGGIQTSGIDFDFRYSFETGFGDWSLGLDGTYLLEYDKELALGQVVEHAGRFESDHDGNFADLKTNFTIGWSVGDFDTTLVTRYISSVVETEKGWWTDPFERDTGSNVVVDLQTNWAATDHLSFTVGVDNLFDEEPPFVYSAFGANTDVATYDLIGRFIYLRAGVKF